MADGRTVDEHVKSWQEFLLKVHDDAVEFATKAGKQRPDGNLDNLRYDDLMSEVWDFARMASHRKESWDHRDKGPEAAMY
jgi:hypothetical protein